MEWKSVMTHGGDYAELYEVSRDKIVRRKETGYELSKFKRNGKGSEYVGLTANGLTRSVRVDTIHYLSFGGLEEKDLDGEAWVGIKGYEDSYQVSNMGRVRSLYRTFEQTHPDVGVYSRFAKGKLLSLGRTNGNGYHIAQIRSGYDDEATGNDYIHILVAKHFIPNVFNKPTVNHINGDKSDNRVVNLEWATQKEQVAHAIEHNLGGLLEKRKLCALRGEDNPLAKTNSKDAKLIYDLAIKGDKTMPAIAKQFGVTTAMVKSIKYKKSWVHIHK